LAGMVSLQASQRVPCSAKTASSQILGAF
jgi:hypothetical protein